MRIVKDTFKKMNKAAVVKSIEGNFASTYLTVLGIIQSVVLGILISRFYAVLTNDANFFAILSGFLTLAIIVLVWHTYQWYPYLERWPPDLVDSSIPFLLGAFEGMSALFIDHGKYYFGFLTLIGIAGFVALINTRFKIQKNDFSPTSIYDLQKKHLNWSQWAMGLGVLYTTFVWWLYAAQKMCWLWLLGPYLSVILLFWSNCYYWKEILRKLKIVEAKKASR